MLYLSSALDAKLLLFLNDLPASHEIAECLEQAIAQFPERNLSFLNDVFLAWQRHSQRRKKPQSVGQLRWNWAAGKIEKLPRRTLPYVDEPHTSRLLAILRKFSGKCTFGRIGDTVVKEALMVKFPPDLLASMGATEAPFKKAAGVFGEVFNDTVQALIKTSPSDRLLGVDWKLSRDSADLVFLACLGWEMLGQGVLPKLLKNHEIFYEENMRCVHPQLCVVEDTVGMIWSGTLFHPANGISFPLAALFFHWVRCNALVGDTNCRSLQCAVETPSLLSARDPLHCLL